MLVMRLLSIRGINVYFGDLFFFLVLLIAVYVMAKKGMHWAPPAAIWYLLFLLWLALAVIWGWRIYGYRAFGESRYVLPFFAFFVPYILLAGKRSGDPEQVSEVARMATFIAAAASALFLICSLVYRKPFYFSEINLKNQKIWIHKIISTDQSFHIILLAMFILYLSFFQKKFFSLPKIVFFFLLFITLPVYNRTALISLYAALLVLLALGKNFREILFACGSAAVIFAVLYVSPAIGRFYYPAPSPQQIPVHSQQRMPVQRQLQAADQNVELIKGKFTGYWRWYQNKAALLQVLKKPFFGQHLGGYFNLYIPETNSVNPYPVHNQYIMILLKTGVIGLILLLVPLLLVLMRLLKFLADKRLETGEKSTVWLLLLVLLAQFPYGMGFSFIPLFAIYFGFAVIFLDSLAKKYPPQLGIKKD